MFLKLAYKNFSLINIVYSIIYKFMRVIIHVHLMNVGGADSGHYTTADYRSKIVKVHSWKNAGRNLIT
jgi:hypothetical protein